MNTALTVVGVCLADDDALELDAFATACGDEAWFVQLLVDEGLLQPVTMHPTWRFGGEALARVRRIRRLQRDFSLSLQGVAVMLDLIDEVERLRVRLARLGVADR